jgi:hypothetical protein
MLATGHTFRIILGIALIAGLALGGLRGRAASSDEDRAYEVAIKMFQDGLFEFADRECAKFAAAYPNSERLADVVVVQVQAKIKLNQFDDALALLTEPRPPGRGRMNSRSGALRFSCKKDSSAPRPTPSHI